MVTENTGDREETVVAGQRIGVVGLARSGMAASRFLLGRGAQVVGVDAKPESELTEERHQLLELGGEFVPEFQRREQMGPVDLVVVSPGVPDDHPALQALRSEGVPVIGELELAYRFCGAPMIAVSGTNGKGSTCVMIGKILEAAGIEHLVAGNIGLPLISQADRTHEVQFVIVEVSSFQMETTERFRPYIALLLNISPDHLDRHPDFSSYLRAKGRLFMNQHASDYAIISLDDPGLQPLVGDLTAQVLTFSAANPAANARLEGDDLVVEVEPGAEETVARASELPVCGQHFLRNALAAALAARLAGATPEQIRAGLLAFEPADHLLQNVGTVAGVRFVDDSKATNVAAALADLECLGRPLIVIAGGISKNVDFRDFGQRLGQECAAVCLIGESSAILAEAIGEAAPKFLCASMEEAVRTAFAEAEEGYTVALLPGCASFDMFRDQAERGQVFTRIVRELSFENAAGDRDGGSEDGSAGA
ncbi:MAG TPA: UDP-N-acetylmuramoyl-L-alanine--D-glutamate ligase [Armatimonadota bacterium]|jgi:UDP-N-acetylmuramoylalanine--D-glutamate ligase